jgi:hypothetical protein
MKKVLLLCSVVALGLMSSCKKDRIQETQPSAQGTENLKSIGNVEKSGEELFRVSEKALIQNSKLFVAKFLEIAKTNGQSARPSKCGAMDNVNHEFAGAISTDGFCSNTGNTTLYYFTTIIEHAGINSLDYTFNLDVMGFINSSGNASAGANNDVMLCIPYVPALGDDYCYFVKTYYVSYTIPTSWFAAGDGVIKTTGACAVNPNPIENITPTAFQISNNTYLNTPARITISPSLGGFNLRTECALICYPDFVTCPISGTITYQLQSPISPNPNPQITLNFPFYGIGPISAAAGTYNYTSVLTYSFGNSLPLVGTFTVN